MPVAGMPRVVTLKSWDDLNDVPVLDSRTGLPVNPYTMAKANAEAAREEAIAKGIAITFSVQKSRFDSRCHYMAAGICNKCGRIHDGRGPNLNEAG